MKGEYWTEVDTEGIAHFYLTITVGWSEEDYILVNEGDAVRSWFLFKGFYNGDPIYESCRF